MAPAGEGWEYWERWQVPVCALIFAAPTIAAIFSIYKLKKPQLRTVDLWFPCWTRLHPLWLLAYRAFAFIIMFSLLCLILVLRSIQSLFFYTQWTIALVTIYFALAILVSVRGCWKYSGNSSCKHEDSNMLLEGNLEDGTSFSQQIGINHLKLDSNEQIAGFSAYMMHITYQISAGAAVLTDFVFWGILANSINPLEACTHSLNIVFLLVDTSLNSLSLPFVGMTYFIIWTCTYGVFQWILHASGVSWWPYPFMDLASPWAPLWYFFIALVHLPCYGLCFAFVKAKNSLFSKLFPNSYIRSN